MPTTLYGALALAVIILLTLPLAAPAPADAKGKTRALVVKQAHNPVLGALKRRLDAKLHLDHKPPLRRAKRRNHDLLVIDGDAFSAGRMARHKQLREFSNGGRWVLALDLGSKHHSRAIAKRTGFEALADGEHSSRAFLFRHAVVNGVPTELMLDSERLRPTGTKGSGKGKRRQATRREVRRIAKMVAERIRASDEELAQISGAAAAPGAGPPPEAIKAAYVFDAVKLSDHPPDGHYSSIDHGYQVTSGVMHHTFTVYLDNSTQNPQGNHQVVTYDLSGTFTPAQNRQSFWHMDQKNNFGGGIERVVDRGWWTGSIGSAVRPADAATSAKLSPQATKPETENNQSTVSSEESFSVGYSTESGVTASYGVSHGKSTEVKDWAVVNGTSGNNAGWQYHMQNPCKPAAFNASNPPPEGQRACFDYGLSKSGMPLEPPQLSLGAMDVEATARWDTKNENGIGMLKPGQTELSFLVDTPVTLYEHTCTNTVFTLCIQYEMDSHLVRPAPITYKFDTADTLPIPVKSVQLDATKVTTRGQDVHGTVTLERKAPMDIAMVVTSNKQNAYLGTPGKTDQLSSAEVDISKGETQGTFTVKTNFNGLDPGDSVTAYITPFYAKTYPPARLIIARPDGS